MPARLERAVRAQGPSTSEVNHRLPFPQAVRPLQEEGESLPEVVATRPQPKLPSDRRLEREVRGASGDRPDRPGPSGPSPGGSSATYSPAFEGNSPLDLRSTSVEDPEGKAEKVIVMGGELSEQTVPSPMRPAPKRSASDSSQTRSDDAEVVYLRKNVEHLRFAKRRLEEKVQELESRCGELEQRKQQYKLLYEQALQHQAGGGGMEISSLHQQLSAISLLKDALNQENMDLARRLEAVEKRPSQAQCVICMDNLANIVCMPCKHLAMCSFCGLADFCECPICRSAVTDVMQIFTP